MSVNSPIRLTPIDRYGNRLSREPFIWRMSNGFTRIGWRQFSLLFFWNSEVLLDGKRWYGVSLRWFGCSIPIIKLGRVL